jgi:hypothetical protein
MTLKVCFWHGVWCGVLPCKGAYPELFSIACLRNASVIDHLQFSNCSFIYFWLGVSFVYVLCTWVRPLVLMKFDYLYKTKKMNFQLDVCAL